jgi:hypothetical protein
MNTGYLAGGIAGLVVVAPAVVLLFNRVLRAVEEIEEYTRDILVNGVALTGDLDPLPALAETRRQVERLEERAVRYLEALRPLL